MKRVVRPLMMAVLVILFGLAAAAVALYLLPPKRSGQQALNNQQIAQHFLTIAYGREHAKEPAQHLAKWAGPIRYALVRWTGGADAQRAETAVHRQMALLGELTGLKITRSPVFEANFVIALTNERLFEWQVRRSLASANRILGSRIANANCAGFFSQDADTKAIIQARVIIPVDRAVRRRLLDRCVVEETTQVLGLPNDADGGVQSVFNDADRSVTLSPLDRLFVRMLYDPRLKPGMNRAQTTRAVRQILPALRLRMRY